MTKLLLCWCLLGSEDVRSMERVLSILKKDPNEKAWDNTTHLTGNECVLIVEYLRREVSKVTKREYPQRLRRVLEVVKRGED